MLMALVLFLQVVPQLRIPPHPEAIEIVGPYKFREDQGQTTKVILKNGLTVLVREQQAVPLTSISTYVKAGYLNAHTYYDRTVYYTVVPAESTRRALDIQADALWNSTFDATELKREIEVVLQVNNRKLDNPPAVALEKMFATAFQEHRMRRWRIGTPEGLRALTRDDVIGYFKKYYRPSNIILSIAGRLDTEETLDEVAKLYGGAEDQAVEHNFGPAEPQQNGTRYGWLRGAIEQNHVAMGFHGPGILTDDARALQVVAAILSEGRASVLNQYVRDEKSLITNGSASLI